MAAIFSSAEFWISCLVFVIIAIQAVYYLIFSVAGRFAGKAVPPETAVKGSFAVYIPAYKEDAVIVETAKAALHLDYPSGKKEIFIIADSLKPETLLELGKLPVHVINVAFENSTKAKALNAALTATKGKFDYALVLDADNVAEVNFLHKLNDYLRLGYPLVQGHRVAKNKSNALSVLDGMSEEINNHIFRKGHQALGFSSAIIGSGMAIKFELFKTVMLQIQAVGGFDKELELRLIRLGHRFAYAEKALVYDEKVSRQENFSNQRRRWIYVQLHYLRHYFPDGVGRLFKGNVDYFDKVFQSSLIPRLMMIGVLPVFFILSLLPGSGLSWYFWLLVLIVFYTALFIAVPATYLNRGLLKAVIHLPATFISMFRIFFKLRGANKNFIHTPHGELEVKI